MQTFHPRLHAAVIAQEITPRAQAEESASLTSNGEEKEPLAGMDPSIPRLVQGGGDLGSAGSGAEHLCGSTAPCAENPSISHELQRP